MRRFPYILLTLGCIANLKTKKHQNHHNAEIPIDRQALAYLQKNGSMSVPKLFSELSKSNPELTEADVADLVGHLHDAGQIDLEDLPPVTTSLGRYLRFWERNLWFYFSMGLSFLNVLVVYAVPSDSPLVVLRWVLGSVFVLFVPGYVAVEALFPKGRELDGIERFALSVGLSLALVPLIGLLLNYTPWGIRLTPILTSLTVVTTALAIIGLLRRYRISAERSRLEKSI
jgi:hypothetical protein